MQQTKLRKGSIDDNEDNENDPWHFLAVALLVSLAVPAFAVTDTEEEIWAAPDSGFEMTIPDAYRDAKGYVTFIDLGEGVNPGSGVVSACASYVAMPADEYEALQEKLFEAYMSDDMETLNGIIEQTSGAEWRLFTVYGINRNRGEEELRAYVSEQMDLSPDDFGGDEALLRSAEAIYEAMKVRKLGEKDGLRYFLCSTDFDDFLKLMELQGSTEAEPEYLDEFKTLLALNDQLADKVTLTGGVNLAEPVKAGSKLVFETTDLEGNPVTSEEIFSGHKITMINMWATWCDPCKDELPELAKMAEDFDRQNCRIIGICLDAEDEATMAEGRAILENAGVGYLNIVPFEKREELLPNSAYPTTYFVDENGTVLDEVIVGAMLTRYPRALQKLLAGLE